MTTETEAELRERIEQLERLVVGLIGHVVQSAPNRGDAIGAQWWYEQQIERGSDLGKAWESRAAAIGLKPFP